MNINDIIIQTTITCMINSSAYANIPSGGAIYELTRKTGYEVCNVLNNQAEDISISISFISKKIFLAVGKKDFTIDFSGKIENTELNCPTINILLNEIQKSYSSKSHKLYMVIIPKKDTMTIYTISKEAKNELSGLGSIIDYKFINNKWIVDKKTNVDF